MALDRYHGFVFTPADLAEEADLPLETRKEILYLHHRLGELDHWQLLGVRWNASPDDVRSAYLGKAKSFHPDRFAGKRLGSYLSRIERIFRALTEARDVLCDPARRPEYARSSAPPEEFARMEARRLEAEARAGERRARLARANPLVARAARVQELVRRGKQAMDEGKFAQAGNDFLTALGLDPRHPEARTLADAARRKSAALRARELYDRGLAAEMVGNKAAAQAAFREAAEADPAEPRFAAAASRLALEVGDVDGARLQAEAAVRAGPRDARAFEALGAVLHRQGQPREAKRALERAVELDPALETARTLLKKLRWSFLG
ncbi:MAG TPA: tetratricopeptide repeat protein [Anaeromyxobacteraceae bacterium]|nr:tetratricopeptide repeat protein [Anaeromyxobacteraceae bacterium]